MRILFVHLYNPEKGLGGAAKGVYELASAMKIQCGHEVMAAVNAGPLAEKLLRSNIPILEIPRSKLQIGKLFWLLRGLLREFKPDIVHSHHRLTTFILDTVFKRQTRILHTERVLKRNRRFLYRYGHRVTAVSESLRRHLVDYYRVPETSAQTIVNAVEWRPAAAPKVEELKKRCPAAGPEQLTAVCIGRFEEQKGHIYLVEAAAVLSAEERRRIRIILAGDGKLRPQLERQMEIRGVRGQFIFAGYTEEVSEWLALSDFLILPSLWEGLPRSVIEAFYAGKPVVATDIEGTRDIVRDRVNGLLVPPRSAQHLAQALSQILSHPETLKSWGEAARQTSLQHSFAVMVRQYDQLYRELISSIRIQK